MGHETKTGMPPNPARLGNYLTGEVGNYLTELPNHWGIP
ncbi:MAG: hypothetical protein QOD57_5777 [Actinomycetota bacterium]|jgi:hypothetical protein|nr:hypothetical protein [Actinomycetota bacterium]MDQ1566218.1 hypothetical protein [Actinomycetota bacterium]